MNTESLNSRIRRRVCLAVGVSFLSGAGLAVAADTTPPTITAAVTPAPNANGWNRTNVTVRFTCADTGSGIAVCPAASSCAPRAAAGDLGHRARQGRQQRHGQRHAEHRQDAARGHRDPDRRGECERMVGDAGDRDVRRHAMRCRASRRGASPRRWCLATVENGSAKGLATDLAGNVGTFTLTGHQHRSRASPPSRSTLSPAAAGGYRTAPVTAHFTCADPRSGVAVCPPDQVFTERGREPDRDRHGDRRRRQRGDRVEDRSASTRRRRCSRSPRLRRTAAPGRGSPSPGR